MTFYSEEVRQSGTGPRLLVGMVHFLTHLTISWGTCPQLIVGMVHFITHLTISWDCVPTYPRDEGTINGIRCFIRAEVGFDAGLTVETGVSLREELELMFEEETE